jgi:hypothetical protein
MNNLTKWLQDVKARVGAATPGPWNYMGGDYVSFIGQQMFTVVGTAPDRDGEFENICGSQRVKLENAEFIAASRTDIEKLVQLVEMAVECAEFYGDEKHWLYNQIAISRDVEPIVRPGKPHPEFESGGKTARQFLKDAAKLVGEK